MTRFTPWRRKDGEKIPMIFAAVITVACTVLAAITLLPALFGVLGSRVLSRRPDHTESGSGTWARWSRTVARFPAVLAAAGLAVMVVVSVPVHLRLGFADASNDPSSSTTSACPSPPPAAN